MLLFDDFTAKIADFNLTNQSSDTAARLHSTRVLGTFGYHAPELILVFFSYEQYVAKMRGFVVKLHNIWFGTWFSGMR